MAFVISGLTDYTEKATEILREGVLFNDNFSEFDYQTGISYKEYLNYIDVEPTLVAGACGATDNGTTTITEKTITVIPMKSDNRFCFDDLHKKALNVDDVAQSITIDASNKLKLAVEKAIWAGDSLGNTGWLAEAVSDTSVLDETGDLFTVGNIDDAIIAMINKASDEMLSRGVLTVYASMANYNLYKQNRLAANYYRDANADFGLNEMWVFGYEGQVKIKGIAGLATKNNNLILTWAKNLVIGTDEVGTVSSSKWVIDEVTEYAWLKSKFKLGSTYKYGKEIVLYTASA